MTGQFNFKNLEHLIEIIKKLKDDLLEKRLGEENRN